MAQRSDHSEYEWPVPPITVAVLAGAAWWLVGHLPWLVTMTGLTSYFEFISRDLVVAVPLLPDGIGLLAQCGTVGGALAALVGGPVRGGRSTARVASLVGMAVAMAVALAESYVVVRAADPDPYQAAGAIPAGLALVCIGASLAGWGLGVLAFHGGVRLGLAIAALGGLAAGWFWHLARQTVSVLAQDSSLLDPVAPAMDWLQRWVPLPLFLAAALYVIGVRPLGRLTLWPVVLLVSWLGGWCMSLLWSVGYALSVGDSVADGLHDFAEIFTEYAVPRAEVWIRYGISVAIAAAATLVAARLDRRSTAQRSGPTPCSDPAPEPAPPTGPRSRPR